MNDTNQTPSANTGFQISTFNWNEIEYAIPKVIYQSSPLEPDKTKHETTPPQVVDSSVFNSQDFAKFNQEVQRFQQIDASMEKPINEHAVKILRDLETTYHLKGKHYFIKDYKGNDVDVAFIDKGKKIVTPKNDRETIDAVLRLAEAKEWESIKVTGTPAFRREVWLEAKLRGFEVEGYTPKAQDLELLATKQSELAQNSISAGSEREINTGFHRKTDSSFENEPRKNPQEKTKIPDSLAGILVEHGKAPYNFNPEEKESYYVKLETQNGLKTIWGVDLERAIQESNAKVSQNVQLANLGMQEVLVHAYVRDAHGKIIGQEEKVAHRNTWEVTPEGKIASKISEKILDKHNMPESVKKQVSEAIHKKAATLKNKGVEIKPPKIKTTVPEKAQKITKTPEPPKSRSR